MLGETASKFTRMARVLPNNEKSFALIKEEEAKEAAAKEKEQAVSTFQFKCLKLTSLNLVKSVTRT